MQRLSLLYDYMYKIDTPEYGRGKATTENLIQKVVLRQVGANSHMIMTELWTGAAQFAAKRFHLVPLG